MTLLISGCTKKFAIASSDMRITSRINGKYVSVDENFNKHIVFSLDNFKAIITYTGLAKWFSNGKEYRMYELISDSISSSIKCKYKFANIIDKLTFDINHVLEAKDISHKLIELHIVGSYNDSPCFFMVCISNMASVAPWSKNSEFEVQKRINGFNVFTKLSNHGDFMIGGAKNSIRDSEINLLKRVFDSNADGFNISNLSARQIYKCSQRSEVIGKKSVTTIIPLEGFIDTNYWDNTLSGIWGYMPRMILTNGDSWGPSKINIDLELLLYGKITSENIFLRSIIYNTVNRNLRRRVFKFKKGKKIPGLMGLIGISLYGSVPEGYANFDSISYSES